MIMKLKDLASFSKGMQINGDNLLEDGKYDYLNGGINPSGKWDEFNVNGDTIAISEGGNSCGYVNYMSSPFWCGGHCYYLYDLKCDTRYLFYALKSQQDRLMRLRSGACMPNIKKSDLGEFEFEYCSDETTQRQIVSRLEKVDLLIDSSKQQLTKLDQLVKSRFIEMFGDPATNEKGWSIRDLESVTTVVTYGLTVRPEYISEGIDLVSARELHKGYVDYNSAPKIAENDFEKLSEKGKPQKNDILFSKTGSIGHCALVTEEKPFAITQNAARIGLKIGTVNPLWLLYYLRMDYIQDWCKDHAKGNAVKDFQLQDMKVIPLFDCPLELQKQFAAFVEQTDKLKLEVKKSLEKLETLKKSLMQQYFG